MVRVPLLVLRFFYFTFSLLMILGAWRGETVSFIIVSLALSIASAIVGVYILCEGVNEQNLI